MHAEMETGQAEVPQLRYTNSRLEGYERQSNRGMSAVWCNGYKLAAESPMRAVRYIRSARD